MKLGLVFSDLLRGLRRRPVTIPYPQQRQPAPPQLRGLLTWNPSRCTGCGLCTKDCPAGALELLTLDKAAKRFVLRYAADRCVYCGQCVLSCRFDCLALSPTHWELAERTRAPFVHYYGLAADVAAVVASLPPADPAAPG